MGFCRIWDEHVVKAKTPEQKQEAVAVTIDLCIQRGYLAEYLQAHRAEVEKIMMTMLSPEHVVMRLLVHHLLVQVILPCELLGDNSTVTSLPQDTLIEFTLSLPER